MAREIIVHDMADQKNNPQNIIIGGSLGGAIDCVTRGDLEALNILNGQYFLWGGQKDSVRLARNSSVPFRYLVVDGNWQSHVFISNRMDDIITAARAEGLKGFDVTYTRMVPAHTLVEILFNENGYHKTAQKRYITPIAQPSDISAIGKAYVEAVYRAVKGFVEQMHEGEVLGVPMSGGADSGMVYTLANLAYKELGKDPALLKAYTMKIGEGGTDLKQAQELVKSLAKQGFRTRGQLSIVEVEPNSLPSLGKVVSVIEDYKTNHDLQDATVAYGLWEKLRQMEPKLRYVISGQGGDEIWQDYHIDELEKVTFADVLKNPALFVEGRYDNPSLINPMYSGGLGRRIVRDKNTAAVFGFIGFDPILTTDAVRIAYGVDKGEIASTPEQLYGIKIQVTNSGIKQLGIDYVFPSKTRFQVGASDKGTFKEKLSVISEEAARKIFQEIAIKKMNEPIRGKPLQKQVITKWKI